MSAAILDDLKSQLGEAGLTLEEPPQAKEPAAVPPLSVRQPAALLAMQFDDSDNYFGDRVLAAGQPLTLLGPGGVGKSRLVTQFAACCITGRPFLGIETHAKELRWLVIQAENSNRRLRFELSKIRDWLGDDWPLFAASFHIHTLEHDDDYLLDVGDEQTAPRLKALIEEVNPDVVVFDPLNAFTMGDLNSDRDMRSVVVALSRISKESSVERAMVIVHHALTGKAGAIKAVGYDRGGFGRNSKVLHAWTRASINVTPGSADTNDVLIMSCGKNNNGKEFKPFAINLNPETMIYEVAESFDFDQWSREVTDRNKKTAGAKCPAEKVAEVLGKRKLAKVTLVNAIKGEVGCGHTTAYKAVDAAVSEGLIVRNEKTRKYTLPTE